MPNTNILPSRPISDDEFLELIKESTRPLAITLFGGTDQQRGALAEHWSAALGQVSSCTNWSISPATSLEYVQRYIKKADFTVLDLSHDEKGIRRIPTKWLRSIGVQTIVTVLIHYHEFDSILEEQVYSLMGLNPGHRTDIVEKLDQNLHLVSFDAMRAFVKRTKIIFCLGPDSVGGPDILIQLGS